MIIFKIYLIGFFLLQIFCYLLAKKEKEQLKTKADPILEQIAVIYPTVKIKINLFYFNGLYLTPDLIIFKGQKIKHFKNKNFILNFLRIAKK